jgi:hypothetical protein
VGVNTQVAGSGILNAMLFRSRSSANMDQLDPQVRDVYAEYGCAMGEAQLLERYLVYVIIAAYEKPTQSQMTAEEYDEMLAELSTRTLGKLIERLTRFELPPTFAARLAEAQRLRNWLAHHYFQDRAEAFQTEAGRAEMIRELDEIGERLYKLWGYFDDLLVSHLGQPDPSGNDFVQRIRKTARAI